MTSKDRRPAALRLLLACSLVAGLLVVQGAPASAEGTSDLALTFDATPIGSAGDPWIAGTDVTLTATVTNNGPDAAPDATVTVEIPSGTAYLSDDGDCSLDTETSVLTCAVGELAMDGTRTINVAIHVHSAVAEGTTLGTIDASVETSNDEGEGGYDDNAGAITPDIATRADLALTTADITYPLSQTATYANSHSDQNFAIYEYDVTNNGPSDAQNVTFDDTLPTDSDLTIVGACSGADCDPAESLSLSLGTLSGNDGDPANEAIHIRVKAIADDTPRGGPLDEPDSASVDSDTTDPGPSANAQSETATLWTVPSTPTNPDARPGNGNAFFLWDESDLTDANGGSAIDFFRPVVTGPSAPPLSDVFVADTNSCGTSGSQVTFCTEATPLQLVTYHFVVSSHNVVGFSDPTADKTAVPSTDASAKQIGNGGVLSQHTGNTTLPTKADKQISFQDFPTNTTGVGTIRETTDGAGAFCPGGCFGQLVKTALLDDHLPNSNSFYTITLLYDKTAVGGTGQKYTFYYAATDHATTGTPINPCPKKVVATTPLPCVAVKLGSGGANPALKAIVYTRDTDPTISGKTFPK
jgi:hypothetical protein